jgi:hypothetical protein
MDIRVIIVTISIKVTFKLIIEANISQRGYNVTVHVHTKITTIIGDGEEWKIDCTEALWLELLAGL